MKLNRLRALLFIVSLLLTFVCLRLYLHNSPGTNLVVGTYNIHHLFTGVLLILIGGIPLVVIQGNDRILDIATGVFGAGISMALDEWVYLITTDGTDASYLLPISLWGGLAMQGIAVGYLLLIVILMTRRVGFRRV